MHELKIHLTHLKLEQSFDHVGYCAAVACCSIVEENGCLKWMKKRSKRDNGEREKKEKKETYKTALECYTTDSRRRTM